MAKFNVKRGRDVDKLHGETAFFSCVSDRRDNWRFYSPKIDEFVTKMT